MTDKNTELLGWAANIIRKAQDEKRYGAITIHIEAGTITGVTPALRLQPPFDTKVNK